MHNLRIAKMMAPSLSLAAVAATTTTAAAARPQRRRRSARSPSSLFTLPASLLIALLCAIATQTVQVAAWMPDVHPDLSPLQDKIIAKFVGNSTDYFKVLDHDDQTILVGAKDVIYNISLHGLRENSRLEWYSSDADRELCALKGKRETDCHNYLRVYARLDEGKILLCGTNSYKPRCRHYAPVAGEEHATTTTATATPASSKATSYESVRDVEAQGMCPYSPSHNSTYVFADGQLYSATVADFSGSDPLIYRENLRTEQYDLKQLNQPDFVGAIERDGYVLFFFREVSMEYMNFGKAVYSRVGRVCKNDRGGPYTLSKSWTSFLKARLNCSVPGEFPFYFDEIQAISPVVESGGSSLVYAVFTTSVNAIPGSAICAFNVDDIMDAFEGRFKSQRDNQAQWLPVPDEQVPEPRPGKCVDDSRTLSSIAVNFAKNHPLMETAVPAVYGRPLLTKVHLHQRLSTIAIDPQVQSLNGEHYDVVYAGTDDGKVTKFFNIPTATNEKLRTVIISEMQVLEYGMPIRELVVSSKTNTLLVVSDGVMVTVPLHHCSMIVDCVRCVSLQDPNCAWDTKNHECKSLTSSSNNKFGTKAYLQNLNATKKSSKTLCPKGGRAVVGGSDPMPIAGVPVATVSIDLQDAHMPLGDDELAKKLHYAKVGGGAGGVGGSAGSSLTARGGPEEAIVLDAASGEGNDFLLNTFGTDNKINLHSVDPEDMMNSIDETIQQQAKVEQKQTITAGKSYMWPLLICSVLVIVFGVGICVGVIFSSRNCTSAKFHANHHNQLNAMAQFGKKHHSNGKDVNLLMNTNHYSHAKKPNLDLEKDRSHECKNSTENLEKELPCKTSTLTKVKRTYI